jgi:hypothetical protein
LHPEWLAKAEKALGKDGERLAFAITLSTTESRHGTHILSGAMSVARRQAAKTFKAEAKVQHELIANEKRLTCIQPNEENGYGCHS